MRIAVIGTGLIGASAGLAAKRTALGEVVGWDEDTGALEVAAGREAVELRAPSRTPCATRTSRSSPSR